MEIVGRLSRRRYDLRLATLFGADRGTPDLGRAGIPVYHLELAGPERLRTAVRRLRKLIRLYDTDIVHTHLPWSAVAARIAADGRASVITTLHDAPDGPQPLSFDLRMWEILQKALGRANTPRLLAVSEHVAERAREALGVGEITVLHDFVDVARLRDDIAKVERERIRTHHGVRPEESVLLHVGQFRPDKGHDMLLESFAVARVESPDVRLFMVGAGPAISEARAQAERLGLDDSAIFLGEVDDVAPFYAMADIFVLASRDEAFPTSLVEAMAAGLPSVAFDVGAVSEVATARTTALVESGRIEEMARRILDLAQDPSRRETMATAARERAGAFGASEGIRSLEAVYRES